MQTKILMMASLLLVSSFSFCSYVASQNDEAKAKIVKMYPNSRFHLGTPEFGERHYRNKLGSALLGSGYEPRGWFQSQCDDVNFLEGIRTECLPDYLEAAKRVYEGTFSELASRARDYKEWCRSRNRDFRGNLLTAIAIPTAGALSGLALGCPKACFSCGLAGAVPFIKNCLWDSMGAEDKRRLTKIKELHVNGLDLEEAIKQSEALSSIETEIDPRVVAKLKVKRLREERFPQEMLNSWGYKKQILSDPSCVA